MRKNKERINSLGWLKTTYEIKGLNLDRFINHAKNKGINLFQIKKPSNNCLMISVNFFERQKFFAIAKEMCYNIKKVRDGGKAYPMLSLYRALGLVIGLAVILITSLFFDNYIFSFAFKGSGSVYKRQVIEYLNGRGIKEFTTFSSIDLERLEDDILSENSHLSFVSCQKKGNRLEIELVLSSDKVNRLEGNHYELYSNYDGVIENIKVYRGEARVEKGQSVKSGDLLVDGNILVKEQPARVSILAYLSIITNYSYEYRSKNAGEEDLALILAEQFYSDSSIIDSTVKVKEENQLYIYTVNLSCRKILYVG